MMPWPLFKIANACTPSYNFGYKLIHACLFTEHDVAIAVVYTVASSLHGISYNYK